MAWDSYCLQLNWPDRKYLISVYCTVITGYYSSCHYWLSVPLSLVKAVCGEHQKLQGAGRAVWEPGQGWSHGRDGAQGATWSRHGAGCAPGHGRPGHLWLLPTSAHREARPHQHPFSKDAGSPKEIATGYLMMHIMTVPLEIVSCISVSCCALLQSAVLCQIPLPAFQFPSPPGFVFVFAILYLRKLLQYLIF